MIKYVLLLDFSEEPDYNYIILSIKKYLKKLYSHDVLEDFKFEWITENNYYF